MRCICEREPLTWFKIVSVTSMGTPSRLRCRAVLATNAPPQRPRRAFARRNGCRDGILGGARTNLTGLLQVTAPPASNSALNSLRRRNVLMFFVARWLRLVRASCFAPLAATPPAARAPVPSSGSTSLRRKRQGHLPQSESRAARVHDWSMGGIEHERPRPSDAESRPRSDGGCGAVLLGCPDRGHAGPRFQLAFAGPSSSATAGRPDFASSRPPPDARETHAAEKAATTPKEKLRTEGQLPEMPPRRQRRAKNMRTRQRRWRPRGRR
jgi:hypothetical protein